MNQLEIKTLTNNQIVRNFFTAQYAGEARSRF